MLTTLVNILLPVITALAVIFLVIRLRLFVDADAGGRWLFLIGGIILVVAAVWQGITGTGAYANWFIVPAYPWLRLAHFMVVLLGAALATAGLALYADWWQMRREDIEVRDQKLSILDDLQRDARGNYQLIDLLNMSIKEVVSHLPETAGAVFLLNRKQRQFVLTASVGLTREETALLEYFPLQRNIVSQSIDLGEPMLASAFNFIERSGKERPSRFRSALVLPLVSGMEKIGGVLLLAEPEHHFSRGEVRYLQPVGEWLAEKIKSARLERELSHAGKTAEEVAEQRDALAARLKAATGAYGSRDSVAAFCRAVTGLAGSRSAHLFGMVAGSLQFFGGSEPLGDLSESYRTALVDALDRNKPIVVNQEATNDDGRSFIAASSLIIPLSGRAGSAMLLRREDGAFRVDDFDLKVLDLLTGVARVILQQADTDRLDLTRRKGFETILRLLRFDVDVELDSQPDFFPRHMGAALPPETVAVVFQRSASGEFTAVGAGDVPTGSLDDFVLLPGEGIIGEVANRAEGKFVAGRSAVTRALEGFESGSRERFHALLGERGTPGMLAVCPIMRLDRVAAVAVFLLYDIPESERGEWERLLTLASTLYSMRLTVAEQGRRMVRTQAAAGGVDQDQLGRLVNEINNHLSAVIGNAELAFSRTDLSGDIEQHLRSIISEAELASRFLKDSLGKMAAPARPGTLSVVEERSLGSILQGVLRRLHVADDLYLAGGRAREITTIFEADHAVSVPEEKMVGFIEEMLNRFGATAADDDVLTTTVYQQGTFLYLDMSRHRRNFPPVEPVAGFGEYQDPDAMLRQRPSDTYLRYLADTDVAYAFDRLTQPPSFLSFRFPAAVPQGATRPEQREKVRILAIDDQTVILDLISAMSQSMGYEVMTASSGPEGIDLARKHRFSIVLTDLAMPGMSGIEAAAEIRKLQPKTPIVLVTGWEVTTDPAQLEAAGIIEVLYKPFRIEQLTDIIRTAVGAPVV